MPSRVRTKSGEGSRSFPAAALHPIESYGLIGNNRTAILVSPSGSIDWAAFPRFDAPPTFAALLDRRRGGYCSLSLLSADVRCRSRYVPGTNVLVTRMGGPDGEIAVEDFCPEIDSDRVLMSEVHRRVRCLRGRAEVELRFAPRFGYGEIVPEFEQTPGGVLAHSKHGSIGLSFDPGGTVRLGSGGFRLRFPLAVGGERWFVLSPGAELVTPVSAFRSDLRRRQTVAYWRRWNGQSSYRGRWAAEVRRSALALKLLFYRPTGAMVAAPTTSLPEALGSGRNWDYRYAWVRDTALAVRSLFRVGCTAEATDFIYWLLGILEQEEEQIKVLYAVDGVPPPPERTIPSLAGYRGSAPVRIGNAAHGQTQHDIYGDILSTADLLDRNGGVVSVDLWRLLRHLVERASAVWRNPDHGIWEVRGPPRHYVYSKVMAWVALDRGIDLGERLGLVAPYDRWREVREQIRDDVLQQGVTARGGGLGWYYGAAAPDASLLLLPTTGFLPVDDPVMARTMEAIERTLVEEPFVARYRLPDHLSGTEGFFLPCAFWRVEFYTMRGELTRARRIFEKLLRHAGPLGLYAEEIGRDGHHLGNYPQAFTHLALVLAATRLDRALQGVGPHPLRPSVGRISGSAVPARHPGPAGPRA